MDKVLFSKKSDDWSTPSFIYDYFIGKGFFDPCPLGASFDGLTLPWKEENFINPPFSKISAFVDKAIQEINDLGNCSVLLLPSRTDTKWFKRLFYSIWSDFVFIDHRLKFGASKANAPFPVCLVFLGYSFDNKVRLCSLRNVFDLENIMMEY